MLQSYFAYKSLVGFIPSFLQVFISYHSTSCLLHPRHNVSPAFPQVLWAYSCLRAFSLVVPPSQNTIPPHTCMEVSLICYIQISVHIASYRVAFLLIAPLPTEVCFFLKEHPCLFVLLSRFIFLQSIITPQCFVLSIFILLLLYYYLL